MSKIKPFLDKYWKGINYPSENNEWKKFQKNNPQKYLKKYTACLNFKKNP